jgi:hypothetical protein
MPGDGILWSDTNRAGLRSIVNDAYEWNKFVKREVTEYDLIPFIPPPSSPWDSAQMKSFARLNRPVMDNSPIVCAVAFGLRARRIRLHSPRICEVQERSNVLVPEWFPAARH